MRNIFRKAPLILVVFVTFGVVAMFAGSPSVSAQSSGSSCNPPSFQITSSKDISAIAGESFTYFVVTQNNTSFQLNSELPTGLSFSGSQISGTPQATGDFTLEFTASNSCGTTSQTVNLTVLGAPGSNSPSPSDQLAAGPTDSSTGGDQTSAAGQASASGGEEGSVRLNEIPDTGLSADQALTVSFYLLALLLISVVLVRKLTPTFAGGGKGGAHVSSRQKGTGETPALPATTDTESKIGGGIIS